MATIKARLAKIESQYIPEIPPDVRDPQLIELFRMFDKNISIEEIPCGVSGIEFLKELLKMGTGKSLPIV